MKLDGWKETRGRLKVLHQSKGRGKAREESPRGRRTWHGTARQRESAKTQGPKAGARSEWSPGSFAWPGARTALRQTFYERGSVWVVFFIRGWYGTYPTKPSMQGNALHKKSRKKCTKVVLTPKSTFQGYSEGYFELNRLS
eukprot:1182937-Prorocentrum_minimum.AAC.16